MSIILETLNILAANIISRFTVAVNSCTTTRREGYLTLVYITKHSGVLWPALQQSIPFQQHIRACYGKILGVMVVESNCKVPICLTLVWHVQWLCLQHALCLTSCLCKYSLCQAIKLWPKPSHLAEVFMWSFYMRGHCICGLLHVPLVKLLLVTRAATIYCMWCIVCRYVMTK